METATRHTDQRSTAAIFYVPLATDVKVSAVERGGFRTWNLPLPACSFAATRTDLRLNIVNICLQICRTESPSARVGTPSAFHQIFGTTSGTTPGTDYGTTSESISANSRRGLSQQTQSALISTGQHRLAASLSGLPQLAEHAEGEQHTAHALLTPSAKLCKLHAFRLLQNL